MLGPGDAIPTSTLLDERDEPVSLASLVERPLVLFFYPKDDTPGCTAEVCAFRDAYQDFTDAGATVIGVSSDTAQSHARFKTRHNLPFRLLRDPQGTVRKDFGVPKTLGVLPGRATFVIGVDGRIVYAFNSQFAPALHVANALGALHTALRAS